MRISSVGTEIGLVVLYEWWMITECLKVMTEADDMTLAVLRCMQKALS
jgi:hypothetical protein